MNKHDDGCRNRNCGGCGEGSAVNQMKKQLRMLLNNHDERMKQPTPVEAIASFTSFYNAVRKIVDA